MKYTKILKISLFSADFTKSGLGKNLATRLHIQLRRPEMVEMKAESKPVTTVPGGIFTKPKLIVDGGVEIGLLHKV